MFGNEIVILGQSQQLNDPGVIVEQVGDELGGRDAQFRVLVVDAFEEPVDVLRVEALVDGLLVGGVVLDETQSRHKYAVRLRMRPMNFPTPLSCIIIISEPPTNTNANTNSQIPLIEEPKIDFVLINHGIQE